MNLYNYISYNFSESDDDAYLESYGGHQPTKEEIREEKRARRHARARRWWQTYGDAVKVGAMGLGGVAAAGLLAHGLHKGIKGAAGALKANADANREFKLEKMKMNLYKNKNYTKKNAMKSRAKDFKLEQKRAAEARKQQEWEDRRNKKLAKQMGN